MSKLRKSILTKKSSGADMPKEFFNLVATGVGYLNSVREIEVPGESYIAIKVGALYGKTDDGKVRTSTFDLTVPAKVESQLEQIVDVADIEKDKVVIGFTAGDIRSVAFSYTNKEKVTKQAANIKGRLIKISFASVNGEKVWENPENKNRETSSEVLQKS